jgi:hypothetical protein
MELIHAAEKEETGRVSMGAFQMLFAGNMGQPPRVWAGRGASGARSAKADTTMKLFMRAP